MTLTINQIRWILRGLAAVQIALVLLVAFVRPFWFDEIFTVRISRFSSLAEFYRHLVYAGDFQPPVAPWLVHTAQGIAGGGTGWSRMPFVLCFTLAVWHMGRWAGRQWGEAVGWLAAGWIWTAAAYADEARGYAPLLLASMWVWTGWTLAAREGEHRRRGLLLLCLGMLLATGSHFYGLFLWIPVGLGEAVRWYRTRHIDFAVAVSCLPALLPVVLYREILLVAAGYRDGYHDQASISALWEGYLLWLPPPAICAMTLAGVVTALLLSKSRCRNPASALRLPIHEATGITALLLVPVFGAGVALMVTGIYTGRHYLPVLPGFALAGGWLAGGLVGKETKGLYGLAVWVWILCLGMQTESVRQAIRTRYAAADWTQELKSRSNQPIAVRTAPGFLQLTSLQNTPRLIYLHDEPPNWSPAERGTAHRSLMALARETGLPVASFETLKSRNDNVWVLDLNHLTSDGTWRHVH